MLKLSSSIAEALSFIGEVQYEFLGDFIQRWGSLEVPALLQGIALLHEKSYP